MKAISILLLIFAAVLILPAVIMLYSVVIAHATYLDGQAVSAAMAFFIGTVVGVIGIISVTEDF